ncbi:MAG TPA: hypothetical protein VFM53_14600 [Anaeromyxobacteraceae bacterium]|nr:hypothetical protein [Anaeromyxobacteraceae bacterium]
MRHRQRLFDCVFARDRNEYRFPVRAASAGEAGEHLRDSLAGNGVREAGTLLVRDRRGVVLLQADYAGLGG